MASVLNALAGTYNKDTVSKNVLHNLNCKAMNAYKTFLKQRPDVILLVLLALDQVNWTAHHVAETYGCKTEHVLKNATKVFMQLLVHRNVSSVPLQDGKVPLQFLIAGVQ